MNNIAQAEEQRHQSIPVSGSSRWLLRYGSKPGPKFRLFCFPFAGGSGTVFRNWNKRLPRDVEVVALELPGRQRRFGEPLIRRMDQLLEVLVKEIEPLLDVPSAFFGHSLGGTVCFELARRLRDLGKIEPRYLFVSGCGAPQTRRSEKIRHKLPDDAFVDSLVDLGGIPQGLLEHKELLSLVLPVLRADVEMIETWSFEADTPLDLGITAFGGLADPDVTSLELEAWRAQTRLGFHSVWIPGDHFFIQSNENLVLEVIARDIEAWMNTLAVCA